MATKPNKPPIKEKYIKTPERLWELFLMYRGWAKSNPYLVKDWVGGVAKEVIREKERPLTFIGFECYLAEEGTIQDLDQYLSNRDGRYEAYVGIITRIKKTIEAEQFEGASAGMYNANIIARKLGLTEKTDNKNENTNKNFDVTLDLK